MGKLVDVDGPASGDLSGTGSTPSRSTWLAHNP
jgi:hypothetical protein